MNPEPPSRPSSLPLFAQDESWAHKSIMANIIQAMSDGVMVISSQGDIVLANKALSSILGLSIEEMLGKGWGELFLLEQVNEDFTQVVVEVIQKGAILSNRKVSYTAPDGSQRELIATTSLLKDGDATLGLVAVFKDITELDQVYRSERKLLVRSRRLVEERQESLDRLARAVAHEVRNPVTAIGGLARRLQQEAPPGSRTASYLERILESTSRLEMIVEQVRAYADLPHIHRRATPLKSWLEGILSPLRPQAQDQGVALELVLEDPEGEADLDPSLMATALNNILVNALEAMPQGGQLKVELNGEPETVRISISDSGRGIHPRDLPYLFDPFFTDKADAVGMSLAISKRIISDHDGLLKVISQMGEGTSFAITLPRRAHPNLAPPPAPTRQAELK